MTTDSSATGYPIAVMSFNRPDYLDQVLASLEAQTGTAPIGDRIYLFQDNSVNGYSGRRHAEDADIQRSVEVFRNRFPQGKVMLSEHNLGVCENFLRAERFFFRELKSDVGYFFEDDMELAPNYVTTMDRIARYAIDSGRIGYFAAYGNHRLEPEKQEASKTRFARLGHHWAFGLVRTHWEELDRWLAPYYEMVVGTDYRERPTPKILEFYRNQGLPLGVSSQDDIKKIGTYALKRASINTHIALAKYIGQVGLHMNQAKYEKEGFDRVVLFKGEIGEFAFPDAAEIDQFVTVEMQNRRNAIERQEQQKAAQAESGAAPAKPLAKPPAKSPAKPDKPAAAIPEALPGPALVEKLFGTNVYEKPSRDFPIDMQGWNSRHKAFSEVISRYKPKVIVDVGVWKGLSTIHMAKLLHDLKINGCVIAVDTFLGAPEHWNRNRPDNIFASLRMENGFPQLYYQFLSNVISSGYKDYVVPMPQTSDNAVTILKQNRIRPDFVHVDAAHEYDAVLRDTKMYFELLKPGGILMGDDFTWKGVKQAATEFAETNGLELIVDHPKWILHKPA